MDLTCRFIDIFSQQLTNIAIANRFNLVHSTLFGQHIKGLKYTLEQCKHLMRIPHRAPSSEAGNVGDYPGE
jgi:hypothetical protein